MLAVIAAIQILLLAQGSQRAPTAGSSCVEKKGLKQPLFVLTAEVKRGRSLRRFR
jgi:hypothetical protein